MSEEELRKDIKEAKYNEENVEKLLYELENDTGNYSCYDNAIAIIYYKDLASSYQANSVSKDKIKEVINKFIEELEKEKRYRYTGDVEEEQDLLREVQKELLEEK